MAPTAMECHTAKAKWNMDRCQKSYPPVGICKGINCGWERVFARDNYPAWMRVRYCPGHREAPEQEFEEVLALSSNEGAISPKDIAVSIGNVKAEQVSKQGDYTVKHDDGIFTPSYNSEGEVASVPLPR